MSEKTVKPMEKNAKIYVAGHRGMVGSAIVRELKKQGYENLVLRTHKELDLTRQDQVEKFFEEEKPEYVFLAAAKVGGIMGNATAKADFMYDNMILEMNVIHSAWKNGCKKLEFLGSSCIYPRMAPQPMPESCLLTSSLEQTNEAYALAKISGLKYCEYLNGQYGTDYISVMPTNLYGPNDNYHPEHCFPTDLWNIAFAFSFILFGHLLKTMGFKLDWFHNHRYICAIICATYAVVLIFFKYKHSIYVAGTNLVTNNPTLIQMGIDGFRFLTGLLGSISIAWILDINKKSIR